MPAELQRRAATAPASADRGFKLGSQGKLSPENQLTSKEHLEKHSEVRVQKHLEKQFENATVSQKIQKNSSSAN